MSLEDHLYPLLDSYSTLPAPVRSVVGTVYRQIPRSWRSGTRFNEFKRLATAGELWTNSECEAYQLKQLHPVLRHARNKCPFYRKAFALHNFDPVEIPTPRDLRECALLERSDLLESREALVASD